MDPNVALGVIARWTHLAASLLTVGAFSALLLAGRSDRPTARAWDERIVGWARRLLWLALISGVAVLAFQTALVEGRASAAFQGTSLLRFVTETQAGHVWLARHGVLLLIAVFLTVRADTSRTADWFAARGEGALLAMIALALLGAAGHAAAVEPGTASAVAIDALHVLAAGAWVGGLLPLAMLLRAAAHEAGADSRPYAVVAARRFSRLALAAVVVLLASGAWNTAVHVASIAGLVGTTYGRLLVVKLALVVVALSIAAINRRRLLPELAGAAASVGRPAMRRLGGLVAIEAGLGLLIVGAVAAMGMTPPARHEQPTWPFSSRLAWAALEGGADLKWRALIGSQVVVLGVVGCAAALLLPSRRLPLIAGGLVVAGAGLGLLIPPLSIDAYPTTYQRPAVTYTATSIVNGSLLYQQHCAACHGPTGAGDGPAGRGLPRPPADLRAPHTGQHTAGDLFWWIGHGIPRGGMPGFGDRLGEEERWDLVNFVRALGAAHAARGVGPTVEPDRPWLVAPDFSFAVGPQPARTLKDYRGRRIVLLVIYTLPGSRPRLSQLAEHANVLSVLGVEVLAVPRDASPDAIRRLGGEPRILFPIVTEGAGEIVEAYGFFASTPHAEFLIDRQGYVRARWAEAGTPDRSMNLLLGEIQQLNAEKAMLPAADEHVH